MMTWRDQMNQMISRVLSKSTSPGLLRNSPGGDLFYNDEGNKGEEEENENNENDDDDC